VKRKARLARLLARRPDGIFISDFERGEIGPDLFRAACRMGRSKHWVKVKNRQHPAMDRGDMFR
jgi:bifunctional non-homologous end joining protein LigD